LISCINSVVPEGTVSADVDKAMSAAGSRSRGGNDFQTGTPAAGGGGGECSPMAAQINVVLPSSKVANLAGDIEELETKCNNLESRNVWLTNRLLKSHQKFVEGTLSGNVKVRLRRSFEGWREVIRDRHLEKQLDAQTASLDQCQRVAKELGAALAQEQDARRQSQANHQAMKEDLQRILLQEQKLKKQYEDQHVQVEIMERRVLEAENCLIRSRADAQAVVDSANNYERLKKEMEYEEKDEKKREAMPGGQVNTVEYSIKLRQEAQDTMNKVSSLLQRDPRTNLSPERAHDAQTG